MKRLLYLMCCFLMTAPVLWGQAHYTTTGTYKIIDNLTNCQTHNCMLVTNATSSGTVNLVQISSGYDGYTLGVDSSGNVWNIPQTASANPKPVWTKLTQFGTVKYITVFNSSTIYALKTDSQCASGYEANRWTGSAFVVMWHCFASRLSVGDDGTVAGAEPNGYFTWTTDPADSVPVWTRLPGTTRYAEATVHDATSAYGVSTSTDIVYTINPTAGTSSVLSGVPGSVLSTVVTGDGYLFVLLGVMASKGNIAYINTYATNPTWQYLTTYKGANTLTAIGGVTRAAFFGVSLGSVPYHMLGYALTFTTNIQGDFDCGPPGPTCPVGSFHTATVTTSFPNGYTMGATGTSSGNPANWLNATSGDTSGDCDMFFGDPNDPECTVVEANGDVNCSQMGGIVSQKAVSLPFFGKGDLLVKNLSGSQGYGCETNEGITLCNWNVSPNCTITPTWSPTSVLDDPPGLAGWIVNYACVRAWTGFPWTCTAIPGAAFKTTDPGPSATCTNPQ